MTRVDDARKSKWLLADVTSEAAARSRILRKSLSGAAIATCNFHKALCTLHVGTGKMPEIKPPIKKYATSQQSHGIESIYKAVIQQSNEASSYTGFNLHIAANELGDRSDVVNGNSANSRRVHNERSIM